MTQQKMLGIEASFLLTLADCDLKYPPSSRLMSEKLCLLKTKLAHLCLLAMQLKHNVTFVIFFQFVGYG